MEMPQGSLTAAGGHFTVIQRIHDVPEALGPTGGIAATVLRVEQGRASLEVHRGVEGHDPGDEATVVISIAYPDAVAVGQGRLDPAAALAQGRIRVRGDLSVLVVAQELMATAAQRLRAVQMDTTYDPPG